MAIVLCNFDSESEKLSTHSMVDKGMYYDISFIVHTLLKDANA